MNAFDNVNKKIDAGVLNAMTKAGEDICQKMRDKLIEGGHFQTGELIDSITSEVIENEGSVSVQVNMLNYGRFIDSGTGAAHGVEGGREGYWSYKDRDGNWHRTNGMAADPFIDESIKSVTDALGERILVNINASLTGLDAVGDEDND